MASTVQIEIMVDESGAVTGFRSLNAAGAQVTTTIKSVATAGTEMGAQLTGSAERASAAFKTATQAAHATGAAGVKAMDEIHSHTLNSLDAARLFRDIFGVHIPRAMEIAISKNAILSAALKGILGPMLALGSAGVFISIGEQVYRVGQELFSVDEAVKKFNEDLADTARKGFMDSQSIEDARNGIVRVNQELAQTDKQLAALPTSKAGMFWQALKQGGLSATGLALAAGGTLGMSQERSGFDAERNDAQTQDDKDAAVVENARHARKIADIEAESKAISAMQAGAARNARERESADARASENRVHRSNQEQQLATINNRVHPVGDPRHMTVNYSAGAEEEQNADRVSRAQEAAADTEFARQEADQIRHLQDEGNNASLKGFQLLEAQKAEALDEFTRKYGQNAAARKAIDDKFNAEEMEQQRALMQQIEAREREATVAGQTGIAAVQAKGANKLSDIDDNLASGKYASAGDRAAQEKAALRDVVSAQKDTDAQIASEEQRFQDQIASIVDQSTGKQLQGFARIKSEGEKQLEALQKKFDDVYGKLDPSSAIYRSGLAQLNTGKAAINSNTDAQGVQLAQKNAEETAKLERDANAKSLPEAQQREAEIRAQYQDRVDAYQQMLSQQEISQDDFNRRVMAAQKEMNAQMAAEAKQERDKLAGEIAPLMSAHPLQALEHIGQQQASKYAATALMNLQGKHPGLGAGKRGGLFNLGGVPAAPHGPGEAHAAGSVLSSMTVRATSVVVYGAGTGGGISGSFVHAGGQMTTLGGSSSTGAGTFSLPSAGPLGTLPGASASGIPGAAGGWNDLGSGTAGMGAAMPQVAPQSFGGGDITGGAGEAALGGANTANGIATSVGGFSKEMAGMKGLSQGAAGAFAKTAGVLSAAGPYAQAGLGLFSAVESNGGLGGALSGAMSGAELGLMLGGPVGAAIGAVAGGIVGAIGFGGKQKANQYNNQTVKPQVANDLVQFGMGSMTYQAAYDDLTKLDLDAKKQVKQWGSGGKEVYEDTIEREIKSAQSQLTREQKAGRSQYGMSASEFHGGGVVNGFGDYATSPDEGWIHARRGETVMHTSATEMHGDALSLMLAGATRSQMGSYYGAQAMQPSYRSTMQQAAFGGGGHTFNTGHTYNIRAIDTKSFSDALMANKHAVRGANNASYAENSGGWDANG